MRSRFGFAPILAVALAAPLPAQNVERSIATGVTFQGFTFDREHGLDAANLLMVPFAFQQPIGRALAVDFYSAYARGSVERDGALYELNGFVDTRIRGSLTVLPTAVITLGLNLPTGHTTHTTEEALVAGVLATELLGFREASWGTGLGITTGFATAHRAGDWGVGLGASYRLAGDFEPRADTVMTYRPGNEARARVALDRTLSRTSKLTLGATFQNYATDQLDGRDLFQSGSRWRTDGALSFRTGPTSSWTLFAANIWRDQGEVTLAVLGTDGTTVEETRQAVGSQNLFVGGLIGALSVAGLTIRPALDTRIQTRQEEGGSGWLFGGGLDVPLRLHGRYDLVPGARLYSGRLETVQGVEHGIWGGEAGLTVRWGGW
jgi:hypothetical protein